MCTLFCMYSLTVLIALRDALRFGQVPLHVQRRISDALQALLADDLIAPAGFVCAHYAIIRNTCVCVCTSLERTVRNTCVRTVVHVQPNSPHRLDQEFCCMPAIWCRHEASHAPRQSNNSFIILLRVSHVLSKGFLSYQQGVLV